MMTLPNRANYIADRKAEGGGATENNSSNHSFQHHQPNPNGFPFQPPPSMEKAELSKSTSHAEPHEQELLRSSSSSKPNITPSSSNSSNSSNSNSSTTTTTTTSSSSSSTPSSSSFDFRATSVDRLSQEDIMEKKNYVQKHRLQQHMLQIVEYCRNEGIIPNLPPSLYTQTQQPTDYSLNEFLETQGIECPDDEAVVSKEDDEFTYKLVQLKSAYNEELEKLNRVCNDFIAKLQSVLQDQAKMRVVTQQELTAKSLVIQQKFDFVRNQLRTNVCNAILVLQKQYNHQSKKRRRSLSKRATDVLNQWFFEHINDPYPSDEEKSMLAAQCVLSMNQVNNWFGNKRIRYKRKCMEQDSRYGKGEEHAGAAGGAGLEHQTPIALVGHRGIESPDGLGSPTEDGSDSPYSPPRRT